MLIKTGGNFSPAERQSEKELLVGKRWHFESVKVQKLVSYLNL